MKQNINSDGSVFVVKIFRVMFSPAPVPIVEAVRVIKRKESLIVWNNGTKLKTKKLRSVKGAS